MAEKRETIEELAQQEASFERTQDELRATLLANSGKLAQEVPKAFFELCGLVREGVRRFNSAADPGRRIVWRESAALAARDVNLNGDFNCEMSRDNWNIVLALNVMGRSGKPDVYIMEGYGQLGQDRFLLRIEGFVAKTGAITYRIMIDFKRIECTFEELAERLVIALIKVDYKILLHR